MMNALNRALLLVLAVALLAYGAAGAAIAAGGFSLTALILIALALAVVEILSIRPAGSTLTLLSDESGRVSLDKKVIRNLAEREARTVFGVLDCSLAAQKDHGYLILTGRLKVDPYANLLDVSIAVRDHLREAVERSFGQSVREVRLRCIAGSARYPMHRRFRWQRLNLNPGKGDLLMKMQPLEWMERAGPILVSAGATLAVILGVIIIAYPVVLAWLVGIGLILAGVAALVALFSLRLGQESKAASEGTLAHQNDAT
jgi:hypothetical protein